MKRSKVIKLVLIGSSVMYLQACTNRHPREFVSKEDCERVYGHGKCNASSNMTRTGGFIYMPLRMAPRVPMHQVSRGGFGSHGQRYSVGS